MRALLLPLLVFSGEPRPNEVSASVTFPFPRWGFGLGYQRALARRVSVRAALETVVPNRGFLHLPGFEELVGLGLWLRRVGEGPYASPVSSFAHNAFYRLADQSRHAFRLGAEVGWRFALSERLSVGAAASGQWGWPIGTSGSVCTYDYQCPSSRAGLLAKGRVTVGVRW